MRSLLLFVCSGYTYAFLYWDTFCCSFALVASILLLNFLRYVLWSFSCGDNLYFHTRYIFFVRGSYETVSNSAVSEKRPV